MSTESEESNGPSLRPKSGSSFASPSVDVSEVLCGSGLGADGGHGSGFNEACGSSSGSRSSVSEEGNLIYFMI